MPQRIIGLPGLITASFFFSSCFWNMLFLISNTLNVTIVVSRLHVQPRPITQIPCIRISTRHAETGCDTVHGSAPATQLRNLHPAVLRSRQGIGASFRDDRATTPNRALQGVNKTLGSAEGGPAFKLCPFSFLSNSVRMSGAISHDQQEMRAVGPIYRP